MERYVVSAECPSCGAPLDFNEGSNSVQCMSCRSNLLVTGRKQVLSYYFGPKIDEKTAAAISLAAHKEMRPGTCRIDKAGLYFVPYYRLTGHEFRWDRAEQKPDQDGDNFISIVIRGEVFSDALFDAGGNSPNMTVNPLLFSESGSFVHTGSQDIQINNRYVEKNFIACNLSGLTFYSLGLRPTVIKLKMFHKEDMAQLGNIATTDLSPEKALSRMMMVDRERLVYRTVLDQILSLVYSPYWVVEMSCLKEKMLVMLDAVSGSVIKPDAPISIYDALNRDGGGLQKTTGFRALVCPNCGWDLPAAPDSVIFFCSSCSRAWQIFGSDFNEITYEIAQVPGENIQENSRYLPFWILQTGCTGDTPFRFFLPAFRCRRLQFLSDLAAIYTKAQPTYTVLEGGKLDAGSGSFYGCCYDQEDAALFSHFVFEGLKAKQPVFARSLKGDIFTFEDVRLVWFPFAVSGPSITDPFTGFSTSLEFIT
ncbi:MAG: hypothetical protein HQL08_01470 [Nitrospirae bacterium]|nr:hypothetical protein [Nitrospirota bacterium]